jgi:hypothetical protein
MKIVYPNLKTPCMDCTERHVGCHSGCDRYKEYKENYEQIRKEIRKEAEKQTRLDDYEILRIKRIKERKKHY